jgi:hypothetical protein
LTKLVIERPLRKLDLGNKHRLDPPAAFHDHGRDPETPSAFGFLGQVDKGTGRDPKLLQLRVDTCQEFL